MEFKNLDNSATILFDGNNIIDFSIDNSLGYFDSNDIEVFKSLSSEDRAKVAAAFMTFGSGFNKTGVAEESFRIMQLFINDLMADGVISQNSAFGIVLYNGNWFNDSIKWSRDAWFGDDTLTDMVASEIRSYLNTLAPEQRALGIAHFAHSGDFRPTIEGLNKYTDLNVHTIINYEGPYVGDMVITNPHLGRVINVYGTAPAVTVNNPYMLFRWGVTGPYLDVTQFRMNDDPIPFLGNVEFTGVGRTIENINFKVIDARHSDFSHISWDETNIATNFFMRELNKAAAGLIDWDVFINQDGIRPISYDDNKKVWNYEVDPIELQWSYEK